MDIRLASPVPRQVGDLRPSADAAAAARVAEPPLAVEPPAAVSPVSPAQGALVARGLLDPQGVSPSGATEGGGEATPSTPDRPPPRVLKPWGVPMLPTEEKRAAPEVSPLQEEQPAAEDPRAAGNEVPIAPLPAQGICASETAPFERTSPTDAYAVHRDAGEAAPLPAHAPAAAKPA